MDKKKLIIIAGSVVALYGLALLVFWVVVRVREKEYLDEAPPDEQDGDKSVHYSSKLPTFPLKWGSGTSRNENVAQAKKYVRNVQVLCNTWVGAGLAKDGVWGNDTELAVQKLKSVGRVKPKGGEKAFGAIQTPFPFSIADIQVPLSDSSKVQIYVSRYNDMIRWHNENYKKYQPI